MASKVLYGLMVSSLVIATTALSPPSVAPATLLLTFLKHIKVSTTSGSLHMLFNPTQGLQSHEDVTSVGYYYGTFMFLLPLAVPSYLSRWQ